MMKGFAAMVDAAHLVRHIEARQKTLGKLMGYELRQYSAAIEVLRQLLSQRWIRKNLSAIEEESYLGRRDGLRKFTHMARVVRLGEGLFNLQAIQGFETCISDLRKHPFETVLAKVDAARLLHGCGMLTRFRWETGRGGDDYDIAMMIAGQSASCEVKSLLETTEFTEAKVRNRLRRSSWQQRRFSGARCVFLRIPAAWVGNELYRSSIRSLVAQSFRCDKGLSTVVIYCEQWYPRPGGGATSAIGVAELHNPEAANPLPEFAQVSKAWPDALPDGWRGIDSIVCTTEQLVEAREKEEQSRHLIRSLGAIPAYEFRAGIIFKGSLAEMRAAKEEDVMTVVDFDCTRLSVPGLEPGKSVTVVLRRSPIPDFQLARGLHRSEFQLQVPGRTDDPRWITGSAGEVDVTAMPPFGFADSVPSAQPERSMEMEAVAVRLRKLFIAMRFEGDLPEQEFVLRNVSMRIVKVKDLTSIFEVLYLDGSVRV